MVSFAAHPFPENRACNAARGFRAAQCASDDEVRDLDQITELDEIRRLPEMLVIVGDFLAKQVDPCFALLQPLRRPDDPDVVPHEAADLAPGLGDDDFVAVGDRLSSQARPRARRRASPSWSRRFAALAEDQAFERLLEARRLAPWRPDWVTSPAA